MFCQDLPSSRKISISACDNPYAKEYCCAIDILWNQAFAMFDSIFVFVAVVAAAAAAYDCSG